MAPARRLRSYLTRNEVASLLRSTQKSPRHGARNHAMILIACRHADRDSPKQHHQSHKENQAIAPGTRTIWSPVYYCAMSADPIVYCLERVTDYRDFERLCSALMAGAGYPCLDPLGGTGDEGRDAIIRSDDAGRKIGFAYTVRADWRVKLGQDCKRVREMGHDPAVFVFACTEPLSASEKDDAHALVAKICGSKLDLFDLERLRVQLVSPQRHLIAQHPSIFAPPFFPQRGGQSIAESRDTLLIDHVAADHALATWLARRLSLAGFRSWCNGTAPLAGESADETVRRLLEVRAKQYLPVITPASLSDIMFLERCTIAGTTEDLVLPCAVVAAADQRMPTRVSKLAPADFSGSWKVGLSQVLARLGTLGIKPDLDPDRARQIALGDYLPTRVTTATPEPVFANVFPLNLPETMLIYDLREQLNDGVFLELRKRWAFVEFAPRRLVAFTPPPKDAIPAARVERTPEFVWREFPERLGTKSADLAKELARRSLEVACAQKGLALCTDRKVFYFPKLENGEWNQSIQHVDGRSTTVYLTGERTKRSGQQTTTFLYQLAPRFLPRYEDDGSWNVVVRIYVRVTTAEGALFEGKDIGRHRKRVTRSWWNQQWLPRLLGVVQALQTSQGLIEVGEIGHTVQMQTKPLSWQCPVGLDVVALSSMADIGEELAQSRARDDDDDDDDTEAAAAAPEGEGPHAA